MPKLLDAEKPALEIALLKRVRCFLAAATRGAGKGKTHAGRRSGAVEKTAIVRIKMRIRRAPGGFGRISGFL